jgi:hypothetical protein
MAEFARRMVTTSGVVCKKFPIIISRNISTNT